MPGVPGRGSRFAGVENRVLRRLAHDEASARVHSTICERSLQHKRRINGGAEWVPPLDRTSGAGLTMPAFVGVVRATCENQSRQMVAHFAGGASRRPRLGPDELVHVV